MQRLDKFLSEAGAASRKELREMIRAGRVSVNGVVERSPERKVSRQEEIRLDGVVVRGHGRIVLMLHKPAGYVTSTEDPRDKTVMELIPRQYGAVVPVGRLDKDTEGLLLFTNDGTLAHHLISPRHEVEKVYYAEYEGGEVTAEDVECFASGCELKDGTVCLPAELEAIEPGKCLVKIHEGKYHQVRRMLASRGKPVTYLKRLSLGRVTLGELPVGMTRELTISEIAELENCTN